MWTSKPPRQERSKWDRYKLAEDFERNYPRLSLCSKVLSWIGVVVILVSMFTHGRH